MDPNQCLKYLFRRLQKSFSKLKGCVLLKAYSDYAASLQWPATDGCELQFIGKFSQHTSPLRICSTLWLVWADIIPWLQVRIHPLWDEDFGGEVPDESYIFCKPKSLLITPQPCTPKRWQHGIHLLRIESWNEAILLRTMNKKYTFVKQKKCLSTFSTAAQKTFLLHIFHSQLGFKGSFTRWR